MTKNIFTECEKAISEKEIRQIEQDLGITLPSDFIAHYRRYNGGTPEKTMWRDETHDYLEVRDFMSFIYCKDFGDDQDYTLNGRAKEEWREKTLPPTLLPFAFDWGGNYFCIDLITGHVCYFVKDVWSDNISTEKNWEINTDYVTDSISKFIENLQINDDD